MTDNNMVRRVANAICKTTAEFHSCPADFNCSDCPYIPDARTAITAMREPTEAMAKTGGDWWYATLHNSKGQQENGTIIWLSMIDAALK